MSKITEQIKQFEKGLSSLKLEVDNSIVQSLLNLFEPIKAALENKLSDVSADEFSEWINEVIRFNEESIFGTGKDDIQVKLLNQVKDKYASIVNERKDKTTQIFAVKNISEVGYLETILQDLIQVSKSVSYRTIQASFKMVIDAIQQKIDERKDNVGAWVSVEDILPAYNKNVLVFSKSGNTEISFVDAKGKLDFGLELSDGDYYTHWMLLPSPPESQPQQKEVDEEKELEERTDRNMNVISDFCEHLKNENIVIPEEVILSFFNA
jgi:hypothetical protein